MKEDTLSGSAAAKKRQWTGQMHLRNFAGIDLPGGLRARQALLDFLQMGPCRTLDGLLALYLEQDKAPTRRRQTLQDWNSRYEWQVLAAQFDAERQTGLEQEKLQHVRDSLEEGLALGSERVIRLKNLYQRLESWLEGSWQVLPVFEENAFSSKEGAQLLRFIDRLLVHMRGILDDLAAETGGRSRQPDSSDQIVPGEEDLSARPDLTRLSADEKRQFWQLLQKATPPAAGTRAAAQQTLPGIFTNEKNELSAK